VVLGVDVLEAFFLLRGSRGYIPNGQLSKFYITPAYKIKLHSKQLTFEYT
jgi:hypothetical protein